MNPRRVVILVGNPDIGVDVVKNDTVAARLNTSYRLGSM